MNRMTIPEITGQTLPKEMKEVDSKLFKAIKKSVKGREAVECNNKLRASCPRGQGRVAVRLLDEFFQFEAFKIAGKANVSL